MTEIDVIKEKITDIETEMKKHGFWQQQVPQWVHHYQKQPQTQVEFSEWLQFVFLPNKIQGNKLIDFGNIAPQAARFFGNEISKGKLLQLLVELDSLTE